jgi:hypothetical protein
MWAVTSLLSGSHDSQSPLCLLLASRSLLATSWVPKDCTDGFDGWGSHDSGHEDFRVVSCLPEFSRNLSPSLSVED